MASNNLNFLTDFKLYLFHILTDVSVFVTHSPVNTTTPIPSNKNVLLKIHFAAAAAVVRHTETHKVIGL